MTEKKAEMESSLTHLGARAFAWDLGGQASGQLMHILIRLVLARLLVPEDFGLVAIAMLVISFSWWFMDLGFGAFLIQCKAVTEQHKSTAFWSNGILALLVCFLMVALAPALAEFFQNPELTLIIIALSLRNILSFPESTMTALLQKELNFRPIALRKLVATFIGGSCGIVAALTGFGVWALVVDSLMRAAIGSLLLYAQSGWKPKFLFDQHAFKEMWEYSRFLLLARFTSYVSRNLDTLIIGRALGAYSLGLYNVAYQFVLFPLLHFSRSVNNVLFSVFSKLGSDSARISELFITSSWCVAALVFPPMTVIALYSEQVIDVLLGQQWADTAALVPYMCGVGCIQTLYSLLPSLYQSQARTRQFSRFVLVNALAIAGALLAGAQYGILGVAQAYLIASLIVFPFQIFYALRLLQVDIMAYLAGLLRAIGLTIVVVMPVLIFGETMTEIGWSAAVYLGLGVAMYGLLVWYSVKQLMEVRLSR
ncbi:lipopolysaccharide biosynthesis protein [Halieaceae bacterium IMCC14734]|uniref:Lipopolysaccharide biosynthesis protein n=1 Tax=Candidatus Litorirhabdus singularis TaxID=2518993 RepID=A0ABT3TEW2_9GAMM|nr:lipopolysaccharide biosynthesis protein [Candidatus Litorirhabdus singularis]MCX2980823.1 lipopolysaccharide biosynthesis protein [Candidatus Litorirhabdus singularis]